MTLATIPTAIVLFSPPISINNSCLPSIYGRLSVKNGALTGGLGSVSVTSAVQFISNEPATSRHCCYFKLIHTICRIQLNEWNMAVTVQTGVVLPDTAMWQLRCDNAEQQTTNTSSVLKQQWPALGCTGVHINTVTQVKSAITQESSSLYCYFSLCWLLDIWFALSAVVTFQDFAANASIYFLCPIFKKHFHG